MNKYTTGSVIAIGGYIISHINNITTMYYAEDIIKGVLSCKYTPDSEWIPLSPEAMTERYKKMKEQYIALATIVEQVTEKLSNAV